jgi:hypothetical protein
MHQLNELLSKAKAASLEYEIAKTQYKIGDERRNIASHADTLAWHNLHQEVCKSCPLIMTTIEGERLNVGTGGLLVDRSMFFYSKKVNATTFLKGFNFAGVDRFEAIETSQAYSVIGDKS